MSQDDVISDRAVELHRARIASAQRFELVGQLAGPVTHEINNALGVVVMYADMLRADFAEGTDARDDLDQIFEAAQRAAWFSKWLNAYSGQRSDRDSEPVSVTTVLEGLQKVITKYSASMGVEVEFDLGPTAHVSAPQAEVEELLLALIADMVWSVEEGRIQIVAAPAPDAGCVTIRGEGTLSGIGRLEEFTFLAPGPSDAGSIFAISTLRDLAEKLGGTLEREQSQDRLVYELRLPLTGIA